MELNLVTLIYLFFRLAPFISVCYFSLGSIFNQDIKGLIYLVGLLVALFSGIVGFLLLETINYIEHYGLKRNILPSGRYERVSEKHSWNSNHILGRIMLYELTRHSDHHFKSQKKYQVLEYHYESPQLPFGYPASMVLSFFPPLWFAVMNKRIPDEMK